jgi:hypothetical protein
MNVDRIVALPTPNDQAPLVPMPGLSTSRPCERFWHRALRVVNALTFPICNRLHLNRRVRSARPIAEAAVAAMEIEDETLLV